MIRELDHQVGKSDSVRKILLEFGVNLIHFLSVSDVQDLQHFRERVASDVAEVVLVEIAKELSELRQKLQVGFELGEEEVVEHLGVRNLFDDHVPG